jgi:shikimate kinase/3-dehydroquinate synthase
MAMSEAARGGVSGGEAGALTVRVALGERSYDVLIGGGLIAQAGQLIEARLGKRRAAIVTDANVAMHHLARLEGSLAAQGMHAGTIVAEPGEATKRFERLAWLSDQLLGAGIERRDLVVALGGGVVGDLAGFAASILRRGIRFVQIPTSLLAQVDSSVGGKTGINTAHGKNLVGAFHQPSLVLADTDAMATLPDREMRAGYAEVAKYGLIGDATFFAWLETSARDVLAREREPLVRAIARSVAMKAQIVARDETETGDRMLLNFGHTIGHALEAWAGYSDRLLHGEAIAIGQVLAVRLSERLGLCAAGLGKRVADHFAGVGLPTRIADVPGAVRPTVDELMRLIDQDKKVAAGRLTFILLRGIGEACVSRNVERDVAEAFLAGEIG